MGHRCALVDGFSLHANVRIAANDRDGLEHVSRFLTRPPIAADRAVVSHESSTRQKGDLVHVVSGTGDLVTPEVAEATVNARLGARGVDRKLFRVDRKEFGYFVNKRASIQTVLVPHYVFIYEPLPGTISKRLVEFEPATSDKQVLEMLAADQRAETARKSETLATPGVRRPPG